jgi:hypothetical protein
LADIVASEVRSAYLSPITFEREYAANAFEPGAHQHAVVLPPIKERPENVASVPGVLDGRSIRRLWQVLAGRKDPCRRTKRSAQRRGQNAVKPLTSPRKSGKPDNFRNLTLSGHVFDKTPATFDVNKERIEKEARNG